MSLEEGLVYSSFGAPPVSVDKRISCDAWKDWGETRRGSVGLVLLTFAIMTLAWLPYTLRSYDSPGMVVAVVVFHILLILLISAYIHAILVDPGTVSRHWSEHIANLPLESRREFSYCSKSQQYKPTRAHYCSATNRLVLNMDHFCPWIANTVGFYNRKFFVQFLVYAALSSIFAFATTLPQVVHCLSDDAASGCSVVVYIATTMDGILAILLSLFAGFHVHLVLTNRTSVEITQQLAARQNQEPESPTVPKFNVGYRKNWTQVFGSNPCYWWLPFWGGGPDGDGMHWPTSTLLRESEVAAESSDSYMPSTIETPDGIYGTADGTADGESML